MASGAQRALMGYLYQFVGAAGLAARSKSGPERSVNQHKTLYAKIFGSQIFHEVADMDAVAILPDGKAVGFQYKYSLKSPPTDIEPEELKDILDAFHWSVDRTKDFQFVEYALITNRAFTPQTSKIYASQKGSDPDQSLYPNRRLGKISKADKAAIKRFGDADTAARARHQVLKKLDLHLVGNYRDWVQDLREHARIHGVLEAEFERAFNTLVGDLLVRAIGSPLELTVEFLNKSLLGVPDALPLVPSIGVTSARNSASSEHAYFISHTFVEKHDHITPRHSLLQRLDEEVRSKSVVFVYGEGGSGKSVLAAEYLRCQARDRCVAAVVASNLDDEWLGRTFNRWRSPGHSHMLAVESVGGILDRLRNADSETSKPILLLDVDGVDEIDQVCRQATRRLIDKFFRRANEVPPESVLIVTCRSEMGNSDDAFLNLLRDWLVTEIPDRHGDRVGKVAVSGFDWEDLLNAADALGAGLRSRIGRLHDLITGAPAASLTLGDARLIGGSFPSSRPDFVESFLHPAMWQSFVNLGPIDRDGVLDQNRAAFGKLADRFLGRFCVKVNLRQQGLLQDRTVNALRAIGARLPAHHQTFDRESNWIATARGPVSYPEAALLYDEAISYGLIREDERGRWGWRHALVGDHLRGA